ncbi:MAG: terminase [Anaerolineales bacterium]|nr:terminase [Anaerolineales bacterium]
MHDLYDVTPQGRLRLHFHPGQWRAWRSRRRFVCVLAGTQGGKTSFGPHWLYREIQGRGPGDYMVVTPTFPLLEVKALPTFLRLFEKLLGVGAYQGSPVRKFVFSENGSRRTFGAAWNGEPTTVFFGHAQDPESLESATAKAAWLDEAGQKKFRLGSWEAILRRLSIHLGRVLVTTTPYDLGWLKQQLYDRFKAGDPDIDVIRFDSTENPAFPPAEMARVLRDLPQWKVDLFYRAIFTRPAGMIYDSFNEALCKVKRFPIPVAWPRLLGLDFGGVNTAALFYARELKEAGRTAAGEIEWGDPTGRLILYRSYKAGGRTAAEHAAKLREGEPLELICFGGSKSEGQWRQEFGAGGLLVRPPLWSDVEIGIDRVYGAHKRNEIIVFDDLTEYLEQKGSYSRELDERGEPTEAIADKATYHFMDAERYIVAWEKRTAGVSIR